MSTMVNGWTVDYGDGPRKVTLPHAWRQDVPVGWEGPAVYRTEIEFPKGPVWLLFHGVSYQAKVRVNGEPVGEHRGIWDAFSVRVDGKGAKAVVEVEVVKNGGATFPVKDVASGFLPYVFNTFGGIYAPVEVVAGDEDPLAELAEAPASRVKVEGAKVFVDGKPFYARGVLTWGWYPELGHTNPDEETIRREIRQAKSLGFNLIKFCLWVPSHRFLEIMREEQMEAWLELPLWDPSPEPAHLESIAEEMERIVAQYRRHDNIVFWTIGCELSTATPPEYRERLVQMVKRHTGSPMVKDNSGGAEMYGGDLREYGDFYDFHPYCDSEFYPVVLDSLLPGPRTVAPILLGEYNDIDTHRDLVRLRGDFPFWARDDERDNPQGVRWQYDMPRIMKECRFLKPELRAKHERLMLDARGKAIAIRKFVHENVRARDGISGYVITGWRDTPIASAGMIDDWGELRYEPDELRDWNSGEVVFLIPTRRPPWVDGGNRPGWLDPCVHFEGPVHWKIGLHSESGSAGRLEWRIVDESGAEVVGHSAPLTVPALESHQVGEIYWPDAGAGSYELEVRFGGASNRWAIWVVPHPDWTSFGGWKLVDPVLLCEGLDLPEGEDVVATRVPPDLSALLSAGRKVALFLLDEHTQPAPFWRESAYEFLDDAFWSRVDFRNRWERLLSVGGDRVIDPASFQQVLPKGAEVEVLLNRIDARTYAEAPIMVRVRCGEGRLIATTLRPFGGLGIEPTGFKRNPSGAALLAGILEALRGEP